MKLTDHLKLPDWPYLIKDYRIYLGLSVFQFSELYHVSRQSAYNWERGKIPPPANLTHDILEWVLAEQIKEGGNPYA